MMDASSPPQILLDIAPSLKTPGFRLIDAEEVYQLFRSLLGANTSITALGTNQATAAVLGYPNVDVFTTVAAGTGALLPQGLPGQQKTEVNMGASALTLYGNGADQIIPLNSTTPAASLSVPAGQIARLVCVSRTFNPTVATWKVVSLG